MSLQCGIVGLPNVGKSTLFNALSDAGAEAENFPFCTIDPNVGVVPVPDKRLDQLFEMVDSKEKIPTSIEFVDIAGLVKGASEGKGKGNAFLSHIRETDLIIHVVRCFEDENVAHVEGQIDPIRDIHIIEDELILKDLETIEKRLHNLAKEVKGGDRLAKTHHEVIERLKEHVESGNAVRSFHASEEEQEAYEDLFLLSDKPVLYACNVDDESLPEGNEYVEQVREYARELEDETVVFCAKLEEEMAQLDEEEEAMFLEELGVESSGLDRLIQAAYQELNLITFFTYNDKEVRAWTVERESTAPEAAGQIHTDFQKGFIKAEVVPYETFEELGSGKEVRNAGKMRQEGKDYIVKDGDIILFKFNV